MEPSRFWKITHWLRGGNIGAAQRAFRKRQRAYLDAHKKDKMSYEYMETLELDDLLDIQSKHLGGRQFTFAFSLNFKGGLTEIKSVPFMAPLA